MLLYFNIILKYMKNITVPDTQTYHPALMIGDISLSFINCPRHFPKHQFSDVGEILLHSLTIGLFSQDYPFLKEHNRPPGGMVVDNGHSVVVCKDCYSSLKNQVIYTVLY